MIKVLSTTIVVVMIVLFAQVYITTKAQKETARYKAKYDSLQNRADSLHDELFNAKVWSGRYELTLDHLQEVNPKATLEFVNFMNHETE